MKGTYFYSVEFFFISNVIYKLLDFSTEEYLLFIIFILI